MSVGDVWLVKENVSSTKHNAKDFVSLSGAAIAALPYSKEHNFARCTSSGSGFIQDVCYYRNAGQTTWLPFFKKHTHNADTHEAGGAFSDVLVANTKTTYLIPYHNMTASMWTTAINNTGSFQNITTAGEKHIMALTSGATNDYSEGHLGGLIMAFSEKSCFYIKEAPNSTADILVRSGVGMNPIFEAADTRRTYGIEQCSGDGTAMQIVSCNGVVRTKLTSGNTVEGLQARGYACEFTPGTSVLYKSRKSSVNTTVSKTTNIPSDGSAFTASIFRSGVRTLVTSAKSLRMWSLFLTGTINDENWVNF